MLVVSNGYTEVVPISISATRDDRTEQTETAYLDIRLEGTVPFEDGSYYKRVAINIIDDNQTVGGTGNDILRGTSKAEVLAGGAGNDIYYVNAGDNVVEAANAGTDTVNSAASHLLGSNVENLTLTGAANINGIGNALNNLIIGNSGANQLRGAGGADTLQGGAGNDIYVIDALDRIIETAAGGTDTVISSASTTLGAHLENLSITGTGNFSATGNSAANRLVGNSGNNLITGGGGRDSLFGGAGNDTYSVDGDDAVIESANGGIDTVRAAGNFVLGANIENLSLAGAAGYSASGNALANLIIANAGGNRISGGLGNDTIFAGGGADIIHGGGGADVMTGGADGAQDVFLFTSALDLGMNAGADIITDFHHGSDLISLSGVDANTGMAADQNFAFGGTRATANGLWYVDVGNDLLVRGDTNGDRIADFEVRLQGVNTITASDFVL